MRNKGYDSIWNASRNAVLTIFSVLASGYNFVIDDYKLPLRINPVVEDLYRYRKNSSLYSFDTW